MDERLVELDTPCTGGKSHPPNIDREKRSGFNLDGNGHASSFIGDCVPAGLKRHQSNGAGDMEKGDHVIFFNQVGLTPIDRFLHHGQFLIRSIQIPREGKTVDNQKVTTLHLRRRAYLYVRQSTLRQVIENTESTHRQYALRERAVALGWPPEQVVVIDEDLGQSGASATGREGFQRLVADVSLGLVGIILGLEVSRLARCSSDWYRLLEICALSDTLILDEEGLYNPNSFNDRLLLGECCINPVFFEITATY